MKASIWYTFINGYDQVPTFRREFYDHIMHESKPDPFIQHHSLSAQGNNNAGRIVESIDRLARIADDVYLEESRLIR